MPGGGVSCDGDGAFGLALAACAESLELRSGDGVELERIHEELGRGEVITKSLDVVVELERDGVIAPGSNGRKKGRFRT